MAMISEKRMFKAFGKGDLGSAGVYPVWTPIWALRSRIWRRRRDRRHAVEVLGELAMEAVDEGDAASFRQWGAALEWMLQFERKPENAVRADIYYAIEELNNAGEPFTREDVLAMVNDELETGISAEDLERELERFGLADAVPAARTKRRRRSA